MADEPEDDLAVARRHVLEGEERVARQVRLRCDRFLAADDHAFGSKAEAPGAAWIVAGAVAALGAGLVFAVQSGIAAR